MRPLHLIVGIAVVALSGCAVNQLGARRGSAADAQRLVGRWSTGEVTLDFAADHNFTMRNPQLPLGAGGHWTVASDRTLDLHVTIQLTHGKHPIPYPDRHIVQKIRFMSDDLLESRDDISATLWRRIPRKPTMR